MSKQYTLKDLELPDDEPMVIIRSSLLWMCDGDKYAAAALNMYVHWTRWLMKHRPVAQEINRMLRNRGKSASQETSLILYRKQSDLVEDLLRFCNEKRLRQANALLISKGLLVIDDTHRSIADHILKYELQIDTFKKLMEAWRKYREGNGQNSDDENVVLALDADSDGTDNSPLHNGQFTASERTNVGSRSGQFTVPSGQFTAPSPSVNDGLERSEEGKNRPNRYIVRDDVIESGGDTPSSEQSATTSQTNSAPSQEKDDAKAWLTPEQQRWFKEIYCKGKWHAIPPKLTKKLAEYVATLSQVIQTVEELNSHYDHVEERLKGKPDPTVKPGNLASPDYLNSWKQAQRQKQQTPQLVGAGTSRNSNVIDFHSDPWA